MTVNFVPRIGLASVPQWVTVLLELDTRDCHYSDFGFQSDFLRKACEKGISRRGGSHDEFENLWSGFRSSLPSLLVMAAWISEPRPDRSGRRRPMSLPWLDFLLLRTSPDRRRPVCGASRRYRQRVHTCFGCLTHCYFRLRQPARRVSRRDVGIVGRTNCRYAVTVVTTGAKNITGDAFIQVVSGPARRLPPAESHALYASDIDQHHRIC